MIFVYGYGDPRDLYVLTHSYPTRRSSCLLGLLNVTSPDLLHRGWSADRAAFWSDETNSKSHAESMLDALAVRAGLITVIDGSPSALSWLGGVRGMRVRPLGTRSEDHTSELQSLLRSPFAVFCLIKHNYNAIFI